MKIFAIDIIALELFFVYFIIMNVDIFVVSCNMIDESEYEIWYVIFSAVLKLMHYICKSINYLIVKITKYYIISESRYDECSYKIFKFKKCCIIRLLYRNNYMIFIEVLFPECFTIRRPMSDYHRTKAIGFAVVNKLKITARDVRGYIM